VPASIPLYHEVRTQITRRCDPTRLPDASADRLALLVTGLVAAQSCVMAKVAAELDGLALTAATCVESIERRLRRTLNDPALTAARCYAPLLATAIDWRQARDGAGRIRLIVDESCKTDQVHLFRVSLPYRGGSLPLAWAVWAQNVALEEGGDWTHVDAVLAQVAALPPPEAGVVVLADRAYAVPALIDRVSARGWHWIVRLTTTGSHRFWPDRGEETGLREVIARHLDRPGRRWRARGRPFKDAGWRAAQIVGIWGAGAQEALVVITDLPADWTAIDLYDRRFWIEPGFRTDKTRGWQWETCRVRGLAHHAVLLLALAWATLLVLCLGAGEAASRLRRLDRCPPRRHGTRWRTAKPQPAGESLFTLGLRQTRRWLYGTPRRSWRWRLPDLAAPSWTDQWRAHQSHRFIFGAPVRS
jgi:hypothetical protein